LMAILLLLVIWVLIDSWVAIDARQVGVVLRFGEYSRMLDPGFHFKFPRPVESVAKVATTEVRTYSDKVSMITQDENIMHIDFNVQFKVDNARNYLFSMRDPDETLHKAAESAVRSVIGRTDMDDILSGSGAQLATETQQVLQQTLNSYKCGLLVTDISFQNVAPPDQVKDAFDDVNKAREDKQRIENLAHAYASKIVPEARGAAARILAQAKGYQAERIAIAKGNAERFKQILAQYQAAPQVTRRRLWLETMESVLAGNRKVIDGSKGRNLLYLPVSGKVSKVPDSSAAAAAAASEGLPDPGTAGGGQ
ncbi:MAG: FtsH protease activity modulator HflK, partial [Rhodanobacteraceae bacterium]